MECFCVNTDVRRKVRIGTIPELSCAKWEFSLCPPIPELYRTILELRKGYMLKIDKVCVPAQSGNSWTKWEFIKRRDSSWNKTEKCVMRKRFECLIRKTDFSNNIATSFWAKYNEYEIIRRFITECGIIPTNIDFGTSNWYTKRYLDILYKMWIIVIL